MQHNVLRLRLAKRWGRLLPGYRQIMNIQLLELNVNNEVPSLPADR